MGQLKDLLVTGINHAMDNSNHGRIDSTPPTRYYDASRYERSPMRSYNSDNRGIPQMYYDQGYSDGGSSNRDTRRSRRRDRKDDRRGQKGPTLIGSMRDMLTPHNQDQNAMRNQGTMRRVVPAGYSDNTNGIQAALPATRVRPYFSQQGQYTSQGLPLSQQGQRTVSEEDDRGDYSGNENGSSNPYYADELEPQDRRANDLPPRYEARGAGEDWNSRYESRAISAPPIRSPREKQEY